MNNPSALSTSVSSSIYYKLTDFVVSLIFLFFVIFFLNLYVICYHITVEINNMLGSHHAIPVPNIVRFIETYEFDCCNIVYMLFDITLVAMVGECRVKPQWGVPYSAWRCYLPASPRIPLFGPVMSWNQWGVPYSAWRCYLPASVPGYHYLDLSCLKSIKVENLPGGCRDHV